MNRDWRKQVRAAFPSVRLNEPLAPYTTFKIGGPADCYVELRSIADLEVLMGLSRDSGFPVFFLGRGSNLLIQDGGIRGAVATLRGDFERADFLEEARVRCGAGMRLPQLVVLCAQEGLGGAESLVGVPGTVGGALVMNAGTRECEIGSLVREVALWDPRDSREKKLPRKGISFGYRHSDLGGKIILGAILQLKQGDKVDIMTLVQQHQQRRLQTQPVHTHNVGSIFKNPSGYFAAELIENAGLKGAVIGGARVSPRHANFIENFASAKAADVLALAELARRRVWETRGLELELEMRVVGEP